MDKDSNAEAKKPLKVSELIERICKRPGMWVVGGTFAEACALVHGFAYGLKQCNPIAADEWYVFEKWLSWRLRYPSNHVWTGELQRRFPDDKEAFEQMRLLFAEYTAEREAKSSQEQP